MLGIKKVNNNENTVCFTIPIKAQINLDVLNELAQGISPTFLTCSYQANETHHIVIFNIGESQTLDSNKIPGDAFLPDLLEALGKCKSKSISYKNLILEASLLFVLNGHLKFILLPIDNQSQDSFKKVIKKFVKVINPLTQGETTKVLLRKLKSSKNGDEIRQHLDDIQINTYNEQEHLPVQQKDNISNETETTLLSPDHEAETTLLSAPSKMKSSSEVEQTVLSEDAQESLVSHPYGETALLNDAEPEMTVKAFLVRNKTGLQIPINKPLFMIGNVGGNVDYQINDNASISRHHASIIFEGETCYLIDNESTNNSFVEGTAIPPHERIELDNGALFTLGNENFQVFMETR